jgi:hypothetical protein
MSFEELVATMLLSDLETLGCDTSRMDELHALARPTAAR